MSLTILLGDYGTGKTATAKMLTKQSGGVYLDIDVLSKGNALIDNLNDIIKAGIDYYIDGWNTNHYYAQSHLPDVEVKYIVCMAAPAVIMRRQKRKASQVSVKLPKTEDEIMNTTHLAATFALSFDNDPLFIDTTERPVSTWRKENWMIRWMELVLYSRLKNAGEYQDVELSDKTIRGLSKSYMTWERLAALVDFKNKRVIDYGCNYGYFCFKAEESGATSVIGVDESSSVIDTAISIGITKRSKVKFIISRLQQFNPPEADIILALNTLHHLNYDRDVLDKMFKAGHTLVFEMPAKDVPLVNVVANKTPVIANSHREGRVIAIYGDNTEAAALPPKFVYHPRREAFKKAIFSIVRKYMPEGGLGIARRIKRGLGK